MYSQKSFVSTHHESVSQELLTLTVPSFQHVDTAQSSAQLDSEIEIATFI